MSDSLNAAFVAIASAIALGYGSGLAFVVFVLVIKKRK